jgi:CheY-like chemotaxis protein
MAAHHCDIAVAPLRTYEDRCIIRYSALRKTLMASRILVVDDDPTTCELIQEVLRSVEVESLAVTRSGLALTHLSKEKFDAVFLDVHMPPPDGIELTRRIRASGLNLTTPIMIITGEDDHGLLSRAFEAGANFFLYKPIDRHDILHLLRATHDSIEHERRRFRRVKVSCKVSVKSGDAQFTGSTLDLSIGGMLVRASAALPIGAPARVSIDLRSDPPFVAAARVLRISDGDCMGMQFENLSVQQSKRLHDFLLPLILAKFE